MEGDRIGEAPRDDRVESRETRLVDIGRGDVLAIRGASTFLKTLAPPRAGRLGPETRCDALSLLVRVALDISTMWRDDDEPAVHAVIVQALDKFAIGLCLGVVEGGMWHLRMKRSANS